MNTQLEKMKQKQECERRKRIAEEKHKEWVQKKRDEVNIALAANILADIMLK